MANNVINAVFSSSNITYTKPAYQYDYGMILRFSGIDMPQAYEVHFSNTEFCGESISQIGDETGVTIPDEMFLNGNPIYAWTYLHTGEDDGETVYKAVISVNKRAKPSDLEPTPVQQDAITQAIAALNVAVEQTAQDVQTTGAYVEEARGYAEQASDSADEAKGYAERAESAESEAEGYATRAETAESHAQGYAQTASDKATEASGYASDAQWYADSASSSASDAQGYANDAKGYSESASASASDASGYAYSAYESAQNASGSASDASSAKDLAVQAKDDAVSAKNDAEGFASDASDSASEAKGYAEDAEESAQSVLGLTADATVDSNVGTPSVEVEVTTESDHKKMSFAFHNLKGLQGEPGQSGLITDYVAEEKTPYLLRQSGGNLANVISEKDMIVGGTVAWNQQLNITTPFVAVKPSTRTAYFAFEAGSSSISGHKYLFCAKCTAENLGNYNTSLSIYTRYNRSNTIITSYGFKQDRIINVIFASQYNAVSNGTTSAAEGNMWGYLAISSNSPDGATATVENLQYIDLTQMFGTTIADYLFTLESGPSGSGIAKLKEWGFFTKDYYPYNPGELMSVQTSEHRMVGFNQWDEEWVNGRWAGNNGVFNPAFSSYLASKNPIPVFPNTTYYFFINHSIVSSREVVCYDASDNWISDMPNMFANATFTTPSNCHYIRFNLGAAYGRTYNNDICINISGSKNGTYEPYSVHSYPLDSDLVLRGVLKLDAQNNLRYDGDTYESNGTVTRRFGIVDLGTLDWYYRSSAQTFSVNLPSMLLLGGLICTRYPQSTASRVEDITDKMIWNAAYAYSANNLVIKDSAYSDVATFKTAMSGVHLIYELATPTTEQADPYSEYQIVYADGTEEYVDERTVPIPVGHDTLYQQAVDVPQLPTADGSYRLALSKTGNTAIASWEYVAQAEMIAQTNIPSGKYFSVGERLFVSTQAIGQGETIVPGTNCTEVSLADALNTINS